MQLEKNSQSFFWSQLREKIPEEYREILLQHAIQQWIDKLWLRKDGGIDPETAIANVRFISEFARYCGKTCDQIIEEAIRSKLPTSTNPYEWERLIENYQKILLGRHGRNTAVEKLNKVKSFFENNYINLNYSPPGRKKPEKPFVPTKQQLRDAFILTPDPILRSWILTQSQCGQSEIDILNYDLDSSNSDLDEGPIFTSLRQQITKRVAPLHLAKKRQKTGIQAESFLGEEAVACLPQITPTSTSKRLYSCWNSGRAVRKRFETLRNNLGEGYEKFATHTLRRYFETTFQVALIGEALTMVDGKKSKPHNPVIDIFMGHSSGGMSRFYTRPSTDQLRDIYLKFYPQLRLFPEIKPEELLYLK